MVAPAVTLSNTSGSSVLLHFVGGRSVSSFAAAPAGYTRQTFISRRRFRRSALYTKDSTTSDGTFTVGTQGSVIGYRGATVEILAP